MVVSAWSWAAATASLLTPTAGLPTFLVLTGAVTGAVAAEMAGQEPAVERDQALCCSTGPWRRSVRFAGTRMRPAPALRSDR